MRLQTRFATLAGALVVWWQLVAMSWPSEPPSAAIRESAKFDPDDRLVLIPGRVGTKDCKFMIDTGSTVSIFDVSLRPSLGPRVGSSYVTIPSGGGVELESFSPPDAWIGSLPLTTGPVLCSDLTPFYEASGCRLHGIVGMDFLKRWIVAIDFDEGRVDVLHPGTERDPKWGECVPFIYDNDGSMRVLVAAGKNIRTGFVVDTGQSGTGVLDDAILDRLVGSHEARLTGDESCMTLTGACYPRAARLSYLCLGSFRHENLQFMGGRQNFLGLGYLSRYRVTIDFVNERLYLAKGKHFADRERGHRCGLSSRFRSGQIEVESVDEKSPAHAAGFRAKDVIVKLHGKAVSELKPSEAHRLLTAEGEPVLVTIERGDRRIELSFTPKEYD